MKNGKKMTRSKNMKKGKRIGIWVAVSGIAITVLVAAHIMRERWKRKKKNEDDLEKEKVERVKADAKAIAINSFMEILRQNQNATLEDAIVEFDMSSQDKRRGTPIELKEYGKPIGRTLEVFHEAYGEFFKQARLNILEQALEENEPKEGPFLSRLDALEIDVKGGIIEGTDDDRLSALEKVLLKQV